MHIWVAMFVGYFTSDVRAGSQFISIDYPGATYTYNYSINDKGQIVGHWSDGEHFDGFLYENGNFTLIAHPDALGTYPKSINNSGQVVGTWAKPFIYLPPTEGFLYEEGKFKEIDHTTGSTVPSSINDVGQIVGETWSTNNKNVGFLYINNTFELIAFPGAISTDCKNINNIGLVVGKWKYADGTPPLYHGFLYDNCTFTEIVYPGATDTYISSINDEEQVVGYWGDADSHWHGFIYENGNFKPVDYPGALHTYPYSINNSGQIVGYWSDADLRQHGFLYDDGKFKLLDYPGSWATRPYFINNIGQVVGDWGDGNSTHGFLYQHYLYVSSSGNCGARNPCYGRIQDAINDATTESVILVMQGLYEESLTLSIAKSLLIKGGYNSTYSSQTANTTLIKMNGPTSIKASKGSLKFHMINVR